LNGVEEGELLLNEVEEEELMVLFWVVVMEERLLRPLLLELVVVDLKVLLFVLVMVEVM
jgi:hypothetical protein